MENVGLEADCIITSQQQSFLPNVAENIGFIIGDKLFQKKPSDKTISFFRLRNDKFREENSPLFIKVWELSIKSFITKKNLGIDWQISANM